jgi:hypothetical protein
MDMGRNAIYLTKYQSVFRRIQIQPNNITDFFQEKWIGGKLECITQVGFEPKSPPNTANGHTVWPPYWQGFNEVQGKLLSPPL